MALGPQDGPDATLAGQEFDMSSNTDKIKGMANEAAGNVKQAVGRATGNEKLEAEGFVQERKGEAQQIAGKVKDAVKDAADAVKKGVDKV